MAIHDQVARCQIRDKNKVDDQDGAGAGHCQSKTGRGGVSLKAQAVFMESF